jgi:DNA replication protein DnaC
MRTEERWNSTFRQTVIKASFSPRIQRDLLTLPNMLNEEIIESTYIYGKTGTGKTILAAQMMLQEMKNQYLEKPGAVIGFEFVNFADMLASIRYTYSSQQGNTEKDKLQTYMDCGMLVIDDFGSSRTTDWVMDILYQIINARYENLGKTIITCNHSLDQLEIRLADQRITSRIDRMCKIVEKLPYGKS